MNTFSYAYTTPFDVFFFIFGCKLIYIKEKKQLFGVKNTLIINWVELLAKKNIKKKKKLPAIERLGSEKLSRKFDRPDIA